MPPDLSPSARPGRRWPVGLTAGFLAALALAWIIIILAAA